MSFRLGKVSGEWVWRGCLVALICATQFTDLRYVDKKTYAEDQAEAKKNVDDLKGVVANVSTAIALLQQTSRIQEDHESRLRVLEHRKANYDSNSNGLVHPINPDYRAGIVR